MDFTDHPDPVERHRHLIADEEEKEDFDAGIPRDQQLLRPLVGGLQIRGARSSSIDRKVRFGTLGCLAVTTGEDAGQRVLLTNHHVLTDPIGALHGPSCTGCTKGDGVGNPNVGNQVATILRGIDNELMDAAIAILDKDLPFERAIIKDDDGSGREAILESRVLTSADVGLEVHKRGQRTRLTYGIVGAVGVPSEEIDGKVKQNQIRIDLREKISSPSTGTAVTIEAGNTIFVPSVDFGAAGVRVTDVAWLQGSLALGRFRIDGFTGPHRIVVDADPALTPGGPAPIGFFVTPTMFALRGDSGSVLVDPAGRVVGLVWAAFTDRRRGNAWATPINVIERDLRISVKFEGIAIPDPQRARSAGGDPRAPAIPDADRARPAAAAFGATEPLTLRACVEKDLLPLSRGRQIYELYFRHHHEIRELLDADRQIALVWHRHGGPRMIQAVLDAVRSPESALPETIRGRTWAERVAAILAVFAAHGSAGLRDDIVRFGHEVKALGGMTYSRFLAGLGA